MKLMRCFTICSCFIFLVGCNKYDNEDIAAIVRGQEITVGDIRFMNGASDEKLPELVAGIVKQELIIQEAKEMGLDVTEEIEEMLFGMGELPPENTDSKSVKNTWEFALSQAKN
ncbi:SurA N-terminal domain-containing protein [Ornithinibacillus contaminans]|uniref:hypothetical protein n=1 Tax=Ornithinibacillus contaminans TaxID=694055 RepID=UPI00064DB37D|nr:hypothetical protein [Ornithinibacillus contaminans]